MSTWKWIQLGYRDEKNAVYDVINHTLTAYEGKLLVSVQLMPIKEDMVILRRENRGGGYDFEGIHNL